MVTVLHFTDCTFYEFWRMDLQHGWGDKASGVAAFAEVCSTSCLDCGASSTLCQGFKTSCRKGIWYSPWSLHGVARFEGWEFCCLCFFWITEHDQCLPNDGVGWRVGKEWEIVCLGYKATCWFWHWWRVQGRMVAKRVWRENERYQERFVGAEMGTPIGDSVTQIHMSVFEPLWMELCVGES